MLRYESLRVPMVPMVPVVFRSVLKGCQCLTENVYSVLRSDNMRLLFLLS